MQNVKTLERVCTHTGSLKEKFNINKKKIDRDTITASKIQL